MWGSVSSIRLHKLAFESPVPSCQNNYTVATSLICRASPGRPKRRSIRPTTVQWMLRNYVNQMVPMVWSGTAHTGFAFLPLPPFRHTSYLIEQPSCAFDYTTRSHPEASSASSSTQNQQACDDRAVVWSDSMHILSSFDRTLAACRRIPGWGAYGKAVSTMMLRMVDQSAPM